MATYTAVDAAEYAATLSRAGRTVVLTTGCFDLLHVGHLGLLEDSRELGDALIVGINADARVRALKGAGLPVLCEEYRARMLEALVCVDFVFVFPEDHPGPAISVVRPQIFVKGRGYDSENMPEMTAIEDVGARVELVVSERLGAELHTNEIVRHLQQMP